MYMYNDYSYLSFKYELCKFCPNGPKFAFALRRTLCFDKCCKYFDNLEQYLTLYPVMEYIIFLLEYKLNLQRVFLFWY